MNAEDVRLECLRLALEHGVPLGKSALEYAADLSEFVLKGTYTVEKVG